MEVTNTSHLQSVLAGSKTIPSVNEAKKAVADAKNPVGSININSNNDHQQDDNPILYGELLTSQNNAGQSPSDHSQEQQTAQQALTLQSDPSIKAIRTYLELTSIEEQISPDIIQRSIDVYA